MLYDPKAFITSFGDSSINFEIRFWVNDPEAGIGAIRSEIFMQVWKRFKAEGIEIPFPQRVLHMADDAKKEKALKTLTIKTEDEA